MLPKAIRDERHWAEGTEFHVEATPEGVLLRPVRVFPATQAGQVFGMLAYQGQAKTIEEMNEGVLGEARRRFAQARAAHK